MIPGGLSNFVSHISKPRASGDDPRLTRPLLTLNQ